MRLFTVSFLFIVLLFTVTAGRLPAQDLSGAGAYRDIETFITDARALKGDTVKLLNYLQQAAGRFGQRGQLAGTVLMADAYSDLRVGKNERSDRLYARAMEKADSEKDRVMGIWARIRFIRYNYFYRDYETLMPVLLDVMNALQAKRPASVLFPAETHQLVGWILQTMNDPDESLQFLNRALAYAEKGTRMHASLLYSLGLHYLKANDPVRAGRYFQEAGQIARKTGDHSRYAKVLGSQAEIAALRGDAAGAVKLAEEDVRFSATTDDEQNTLYALIQLSRLYLQNNQPAETANSIEKAVRIAYGKPYYLSERREIILMKLQLPGGPNPTTELALLRELKMLEDTVRKSDGEVAVRNSQYRIEKRKHEIDLEKTKDAYRQKVNLYILLSMALLFAAAFIYWRYSTKLRTRSLTYDKTVLELQVEKQRYELQLTETESNLNAQIDFLRNKLQQIRKLNGEIYKIEHSRGHYLEKQEGRLHTLLESHLMTNESWEKFRTEFRRTYPGHYDGLVEDFPELTDSGQRIVLLHSLGFSRKEIASLLGITEDAVRKSKQRMIKRYGEKVEKWFRLMAVSESAGSGSGANL